MNNNSQLKKSTFESMVSHNIDKAIKKAEQERNIQKSKDQLLVDETAQELENNGDPVSAERIEKRLKLGNIFLDAEAGRSAEEKVSGLTEEEFHEGYRK
jgi:hypothetical protein